MGVHGGRCFTGDFERDEGGLRKRSVSLYGSSVRGTWRERSFTEDSVKHVTEGSGNGAFLYRAPEGEPKALGQGGLGQHVYWTETGTLCIFLLCIT